MDYNKPSSPQERNLRNPDDHGIHWAPSTEYQGSENNFSDVEWDQSLDHSLEWDQYISEGHQTLKYHDIVNLERCRIVVLSGTTTNVISGDDEKLLTICTEEILKCSASLEKDNEKIKWLQRCPESNKIRFQLLDLANYFPDSENITIKKFKENKRKMFQDIEVFQPTAIVVPFKAAKYPNNISGEAANIAERINNINEAKAVSYTHLTLPTILLV